MLATIALCQLDKIDKHTAIRKRQFAAYDEAVAGLAGITPLARDDRDVHALHLYVVRIDPEAQAPRATSTSVRSARRTSPPPSTSCRCTS